MLLLQVVIRNANKNTAAAVGRTMKTFDISRLLRVSYVIGLLSSHTIMVNFQWNDTSDKFVCPKSWSSHLMGIILFYRTYHTDELIEKPCVWRVARQRMLIAKIRIASAVDYDASCDAILLCSHHRSERRSLKPEPGESCCNSDLQGSKHPNYDFVGLSRRRWTKTTHLVY
jgi:hypothetical protein